MEQIKGIIVKSLSGFYYVEAANQIYECRARGIFRKNEQSPLVGDGVLISVPKQGMPMVDKVLQRKNSLIRPPVANLDILFVVVSIVEPLPNTYVIDKLIAIAEHKDIEPVIIFTKSDLKTNDGLLDTYKNAGFTCFAISQEDTSEAESILNFMSGKISAFSGNSGVGKSTLLNLLDKNGIVRETSETSKKLGRGRHTTRHVELFEIAKDTLVADTPGFSSIELESQNIPQKEDAQYCFREFKDYIGSCKYRDCSHTKEKDCAVINAVEEGLISRGRYQNYLLLFEEAKTSEKNKYK